MAEPSIFYDNIGTGERRDDTPKPDGTQAKVKILHLVLALPCHVFFFNVSFSLPLKETEVRLNCFERRTRM